MDLKQIKQDFDRDGYVVIRGFLSPDELRELRARTGRYLREVVGDREHQGTLKNLNKSDAWFEGQLLHGRPAKLVEALLEDRLEPATAAFFDRIPGEASGIVPHYDAIGHRRRGATIWIALDRADLENGCLYYVKGTHQKNLPGKLGLDFGPESEGAIAVEAEPGDAAIHSSLTVHWSGRNRSRRSRQAVSYFYWAASSKGSPDRKKVQSK